MVERPAEADEAAPVVPDRHDGTGQPEVVGERAEVGDPVGQPVLLAGPLREAHLQLVDGDHAPRPLGARTGRDQPAPQERPRRVAVHAQQGADRLGRPASAAVVEQVPASAVPTSTVRDQRGSIPPAARTSARRATTPRSPDDLGHGGVQARADAHAQHPVARAQRVGLRRRGSSAARPARRCPSAGTSSAPCSGSRPSASTIERVCTDETWCVTIRSTPAQSHSGCASFQASTTSSRPPASSPRGIGLHAVDATDAQLVVLRGRPRDAADQPVGARVQVRRAEDRGGSARTERQGRELLEELLARGRPARSAASMRGLLRRARVLAVDDDRVPDLARVDELGRERHAVDEAEARVGQVEAERARRQATARSGCGRRPTARGTSASRTC